MRAWIGLGGNVGDVRRLLAMAVERLDTTAGIRVTARSSLYLTEPWGDPDQDDFLNAVVEVETDLDARDLLDATRGIERALGRRRGTRRWGPRTIDLDILLYGNEEIDTPELRVPHPRLHERAFALAPLAELDPRLDIPGHGDVGQCLQRVSAEGVNRLAGSW